MLPFAGECTWVLRGCRQSKYMLAHRPGAVREDAATRSAWRLGKGARARPPAGVSAVLCVQRPYAIRLRDAMTALPSTIDPRSPEFGENSAAMQALVKDLRAKLDAAMQGGSEEARARHIARGKLPARERVNLLLDPGSPFLELSPLAAYGSTAATCIPRA